MNNTPQDSNYRPAHGSSAGSSSPSGKQVRDTAEELAEKARSEGQAQVQQLRDTAADKVDTLADSVQAAASQLQDDDVGPLSRQIADMASGLSRLSDGLREKSADQILRDVGRLARENPTLFIAGSIALGFGITRFARASAPSGSQQRSGQHSNRPAASMGSGTSSSSASGASGRSATSRWTDADSAVAGTAAKPATGNSTVDTLSQSSVVGTAPAVPGPSASSADAIAARGTLGTASDNSTGRRDGASSDTLRGRTQP